MESDNINMLNVSSTKSMFPTTASAPPEPTFSAEPPPYSDPSQYPPTYGMPYHHHYSHSTPVADYPQPYVPPSGGQPYYPQPGIVYPGSIGLLWQATQPQQQQQQQQQQQIIVMHNQAVAPVFVAGEPPVSMVGAIIMSCCIFWGCGYLFGGIAFILAMIGHSSAAVGDTRGAIRWRNASYGISIAGIIVGIIIVGVCVKAARISYNQNSPAARKLYQYSPAIGKAYNQYSSTTRQSYYQYSSATRTSYYLQYKRCFNNYLRAYYLCIN